MISQYHEQIRLRREFYEGKSVDEKVINGTGDPKKVDQIDKEMEDHAKKAQEARHAYWNSEETKEMYNRFRKEDKEKKEAEDEAKEKAKEVEKEANAKALKDAEKKKQGQRKMLF